VEEAVDSHRRDWREIKVEERGRAPRMGRERRAFREAILL
jgi:hypothetical protein